MALWPRLVALARVAAGWISDAKSFIPIAQAMARTWVSTTDVEDRFATLIQAKDLLIEYTIANTKIVMITIHLAPPYVACTLFVA